jgi:hypothetical protein
VRNKIEEPSMTVDFDSFFRDGSTSRKALTRPNTAKRFEPSARN